MSRTLRLLLVGLVLAMVAGGCSSGATAVPTTTVQDTPGTNDLIPTDRNLSDCVGTLERPDCGSTKKGDLQTYLTFGALMGGMAFIGWRIAKAVRRRDHDRDAAPPSHTF